MFSAPGEPDDREIIMIALLLDAVELLPQLAICKEEAQPSAFVTLSVFIQHLFDVHGTLRLHRIELLCCSCLIHALLKKHHSAAL
jgi:hypothetical protein